MNRGEIWTVAGSGYASKPRPALIVQDDRFDVTDSIVVCLLTTSPHPEMPLLRVALAATPRTGLDRPSSVMLDKIAAIRRGRLGRRLGRLNDHDMVRVDRGLMVFLGLAG